MKTIFLISICAMISMQTLQSQSFLDGSPAWSYDYYCGSFVSTYGYTHIRYQRDTIIDNLDLKEFRRTLVKWANHGSGPDTTYASQTYLFYEQGEKVFQYHPSTQESTLLYDFGLAVGDTLLTIPASKTLCSNDLHFLVDSIGYKDINGDSLKFQKIVSLDTLDFGGPIEAFEIIEKIGVTGHNYYYLPYNYSCIIDACTPFTFSCYENKPLGISYNSGAMCDLSTSISTAVEPGIEIYPNPFEDYVYIEGLSEIERVKIFNINGEEITSIGLEPNRIHLEVPDGVYIVFLQDTKHQKFARKVIKHTGY